MIFYDPEKRFKYSTHKGRAQDIEYKTRWAVHLILPNVELIRVPKDGATGAPHQACLTKTSDPAIG
jgi:hypothetical protein